MIKDKHEQIVFIRQVFSDLDELYTAAERWSLNFTQLDPGKLEGEVMILDSKQVQLGTVNFNRQFKQAGETPKGYRTFAIPADEKQFFKWRNYTIKGNYLMLFPADGEIDAMNHPGFRVFTISLNIELIESILDSHQNNYSSLVPEKAKVLELFSHDMKIIRKLISYLFQKAVQNPKAIESKVFYRLMMCEIPSILLSSLQNPIQKPKAEKTRIRDISFKKAIAFLNSCTNDFPDIYQLCLISGSSQRTLEYAFKEKFGITPQNYIKKLRLNRLRKALKLADPKNTSVNTIAHHHGFRHLGQLSADYKKLFQELPSETLRERKK